MYFGMENVYFLWFLSGVTRFQSLNLYALRVSGNILF